LRTRRCGGDRGTAGLRASATGLAGNCLCAPSPQLVSPLDAAATRLTRRQLADVESALGDRRISISGETDMIIETTSDDYTSLISGRAPRHLRLADTPIAPVEVLTMLADVAAEVRKTFSPASWLIVGDDELVGLCSITRPPQDGVIDVGYGIAPSRQGRGHAGAAIRDIVRWAHANPALLAITAETGAANIASQRVLEGAGFARTGERWDEEDGQLIQWLSQMR
jgi:RimJ/RimL family protein N-acetyltransferase